MSKLCPKCHYLGKANKRFLDKWIPYGNLIFGIGFLFSFVQHESYGTGTSDFSFPSFLYSLIALSIGITAILLSFLETKTCPKCGNKEMLPLDDPEAINTIKKYDLKVGENTRQTAQNEPNPDSLETPKP